MTIAPKAKGPASAATDPDHGSTTPGKEMDVNSATNITPSVETSPLCDLIAEAKSITAQIRTSADDAEIAELSASLIEVNDHIIKVPVASLEDVQRKAAYLLASDDPFDAGIIEPMLRSLVAVVLA